MQGNRELIHSLYEAFGRGDAGTVLGTFDPQIVWREADNFLYADRNPYIGPQQVAEGVFARLMTEFEGFTVTPEKIVAEGDTVISVGRYSGTFRATGRKLDAQFAHAWTIEDGRVTRFQQYTDTAQFAWAAEASGAANAMAAVSAVAPA